MRHIDVSINGNPLTTAVPKALLQQVAQKGLDVSKNMEAIRLLSE